jgi:glycosyltransferase involved in cell wall biosynthesis
VRVLLVSDKPLRGGGGVGSHVNELAPELGRHGHTVERLLLRPDAEAAPGLHRIRTSYGRGQAWLARTALDRVLVATRPDVAHVHSAFTTLAAPLLARLAAAVPTLATLHDVRPFCFLATRRFGPTGEACTRRCGAGCLTSGCVRPRTALDGLRALRRVAVEPAALRSWRRLPAVVTPSRYLADLAAQHGFPRERLRVIPPFAREPSEAVPPPEPARIACVGRLSRAKGVDVLLDALALLGPRDFELVLIGDGAERAELAERARALGLAARVSFTGWLDAAARDAELARAAFLVFPSRLPESFGLAGVEAARLGRPAVGFGTGGSAEWLRDGETGLVAAPETPAGLAAAIARLLDAPDLCARLGAGALALAAERFAPEVCLAALCDLYAQVRAQDRTA